MRSIRPLVQENYLEFAAITADAYPGIKIKTEEDKERLAQRAAQMSQDATIHFYGLFEESDTLDERLLGVMRLHDFTMQLLSTKTMVGGMGGLAVALLHKKEKIARDMVLFFLHHFRSRNACLASLYPFRPDFYKRMGFGLGAKMNQYRLKPDRFPKGPSKTHLTYLTPADKAAVNDCYNRFAESTNGLFLKNEFALANLFASPAAKIVAYKQEAVVQGYVVFTLNPIDEGNFLRNKMVVREFIYETPEALSELLTFIHTQADQVEFVEFDTQDDSFHHLLADPRNDSHHILPSVWHESNTQGVGIMYRVIDVKRLFAVLAEHDFGGHTCALKLSLRDSFLPENAGSTVIHFNDGRPQLQPEGPFDVEIWMDVADFSSMIVGAVAFERLHAYGLAQISDDRFLGTVDRLFHADKKPLCMTNF